MTPGRVLVVDDSALDRRLLAAACARLGHRVDTATDGTAALTRLAGGADPPDLVLLDLLMPVLDGFDTLARIKADPASAHLPVIVVSGSDELDSVVRCIEAGAADHLAKPFEPALLAARLEACLAAKRARDAERAYLRRVAALTDAARPDDALGVLARVFGDLVRAAAGREAELRAVVAELTVEVDAARQARGHAEVTGTEYFRRLRDGAAELKQIMRGER